MTDSTDPHAAPTHLTRAQPVENAFGIPDQHQLPVATVLDPNIPRQATMESKQPDETKADARHVRANNASGSSCCCCFDYCPSGNGDNGGGYSTRSGGDNDGGNGGCQTNSDTGSSPMLFSCCNPGKYISCLSDCGSKLTENCPSCPSCSGMGCPSCSGCGEVNLVEGCSWPSLSCPQPPSCLNDGCDCPDISCPDLGSVDCPDCSGFDCPCP